MISSCDVRKLNKNIINITFRTLYSLVLLVPARIHQRMLLTLRFGKSDVHAVIGMLVLCAAMSYC